MSYAQWFPLVTDMPYSIAASEGNRRFPSSSLPNLPRVAEATGKWGIIAIILFWYVFNNSSMFVLENTDAQLEHLADESCNRLFGQYTAE